MDEDLCPGSGSEGAEGQPPEGQGGPEVSVATPGSVEPGRWDVRRRAALPKPTRLHRELLIAEPHSHVASTRPTNLEPKEAEPKGEKMGAWGWDGDGGACEFMRRSGCQTPREHPQSRASSNDRPQTTHVLRTILGCGRVLCLGGTWTCRHLGDLFSSRNSSTSPGGSACVSLSTCHTYRGIQRRGSLRGVSTSSGPAPSSSPSSCSCGARTTL